MITPLPPAPPRMIKDEIAALAAERFAGQWLKDESGSSFLKVVRTELLSEELHAVLLHRGLGMPDDFSVAGRAPGTPLPAHLAFLAESLVDDGRFRSLARGFPEAFLSGEVLVDAGLVRELEEILARSLEDLVRPPEHWVERLLALPPGRRAAIAADPRIAAARIPGAGLYFAYGGGICPGLAGWLEFWDRTEGLARCPRCGSRLRVFRAGALLSGGAATGRCEGCGEISTLHESGLALRLFCEAKKLDPGHSRAQRPYSIGAALRILESQGR